MKKIMFIVSTLMIFTASTLFAQHANLGVKAGISYPKEPSTVGFDSALNIEAAINKFFAVGAEVGFNWVQKEKNDGDETFGDLQVSQTLTIDYYSLPIIAFAKLYIPLGYNSPVTPYIAGGAGYSWTDYNTDDVSYTFQGFTWQVLGGALIDLGYEANGMGILVELGYRGTQVKRDFGSGSNSVEYELKMSGLIARLGVNFKIGGSNY